jgi:hypothetical protein
MSLRPVEVVADPDPEVVEEDDPEELPDADADEPDDAPEDVLPEVVPVADPVVLFAVPAVPLAAGRPPPGRCGS